MTGIYVKADVKVKKTQCCKILYCDGWTKYWKHLPYVTHTFFCDWAVPGTSGHIFAICKASMSSSLKRAEATDACLDSRCLVGRCFCIPDVSRGCVSKVECRFHLNACSLRVVLAGHADSVMAGVSKVFVLLYPKLT